ncbi:MAG: hypothetical protein OXP09_14020 [Gammaproteobacteria bacterium]|nr:hypothetical protein [Gammaproteobacteria bacterium]
MGILLNRDLSALQSPIDQCLDIQGIRSVFITDGSAEILAHSFVPGIPEEILTGNPIGGVAVERTLRRPLPGVHVVCPQRRRSRGVPPHRHARRRLYAILARKSHQKIGMGSRFVG